MVNDPGAWMHSITAVMNFSLRHIVLGAAEGQISPAAANRMTARLIADAGIEPMLKSWTVIDNHDIPRIATLLPDVAQRRWVQALQFTLPGPPNIHYGAELGMTGGGDPEDNSGDKPLETAPRFGAGFVTVTVPPRSVRVLQQQRRDLGGYDRFKRVR